MPRHDVHFSFSRKDNRTSNTARFSSDQRASAFMSFGSFLKDIISNRRLLISYFKGDTCIAVFALVNNRCAERIADLGGSARRRVV
jgi:hypothetical protein